MKIEADQTKLIISKFSIQQNRKIESFRFFTYKI